MKTIRLKNLKLKNFKGIKSFSLDAGGENVAVYGENATGKTTLMDAFFWLLFNKDSSNRADFDIKTIDQEGNVQNNLDHQVEATLDVDGKPVKLCKVYREKWTKKRGSSSKEFTGHETKYWIDDVPVKKADYTKRVADIVDENTFRLLTDPRYFNEILHWQKRREILLTVCGDISDADVINSSDELAKLPEILGDRSLEDHRKVIFSRRQEVNKELEKLPVRIDEVNQGIPDISEIEPEKTKKDIEYWKKQKAEAEAEINRLNSGGQAPELEKRKSEIEAEIRKLENAFEEDQVARVKAEQKKLSQVEAGLNTQDQVIRNAQEEKKRLESTISDNEKKLENLRQQWHEEDQKEFSTDEKCPTCGQAMPEDQIEAARKMFNGNKAAKLEEITKQGKQVKAETDKCNQRIEQIRTEINNALAEYEKLQRQQEEIEAGIEKIKAEPSPGTGKVKELEDEKAGIEKQIEQLSAGDNIDAIEKARGKIQTTESNIESLQSSLARIDQHKQAKARIEELKAQEKKLAAEYEDLEQQLYLTEQFVRQKVNMLEEKINSRFSLVKWRLFENNINGGLEEVCTALIDGVPWHSANSAGRIQAGIDIINALSNYYGVLAPIWLDNRESTIHIPYTDSQIINLYASEKDKKLRVEIEKNKKESRVA